MRDCRIHNNGHGRMADGGRRGARTAGDDSGAGVVMRRASATELVQNQIELNAGAGVFADRDRVRPRVRGRVRGRGRLGAQPFFPS